MQTKAWESLHPVEDDTFTICSFSDTELAEYRVEHVFG